MDRKGCRWSVSRWMIPARMRSPSSPKIWASIIQCCIGKEAVGDAYGGVPALPESFFIGRDGKIVDKIIGLKGKGEIEDSIKKALGTESAKNDALARMLRENGPAQK